MNNYLTEKRMFSDKILDLVTSLQHIEEQMDDMYKINSYLLNRYKDDLIKEFDIKVPDELPQEFSIMSLIFPDVKPDKQSVLNYYTTLAVINKIRDIMKDKMPYPWYCYGLNSSE